MLRALAILALSAAGVLALDPELQNTEWEGLMVSAASIDVSSAPSYSMRIINLGGGEQPHIAPASLSLGMAGEANASAVNYAFASPEIDLGIAGARQPSLAFRGRVLAQETSTAPVLLFSPAQYLRPSANVTEAKRMVGDWVDATSNGTGLTGCTGALMYNAQGRDVLALNLPFNVLDDAGDGTPGYSRDIIANEGLKGFPSSRLCRKYDLSDTGFTSATGGPPFAQDADYILDTARMLPKRRVWIAEPWPACNDSANATGMLAGCPQYPRQRQVWCADTLEERVADAQCDPSTRPAGEGLCITPQCAQSPSFDASAIPASELGSGATGGAVLPASVGESQWSAFVSTRLRSQATTDPYEYCSIPAEDQGNWWQLEFFAAGPSLRLTGRTAFGADGTKRARSWLTDGQEPAQTSYGLYADVLDFNITGYDRSSGLVSLAGSDGPRLMQLHPNQSAVAQGPFAAAATAGHLWFSMPTAHFALAVMNGEGEPARCPLTIPLRLSSGSTISTSFVKYAFNPARAVPAPVERVDPEPEPDCLWSGDTDVPCQQHRDPVYCADANGDTVSAAYCLAEPALITSGNVDCGATCLSWWTSAWSDCSRACASTDHPEGGSRTRTVECRDQTGTAIPKDACRNRIEGPEPAAVEACNTQSCPKWISGQYGACLPTCGPAERQREVKCVEELDVFERAINETRCQGLTKPATTKACAVCSACEDEELAVEAWVVIPRAVEPLFRAYNGLADGGAGPAGLSDNVLVGTNQNGDGGSGDEARVTLLERLGAGVDDVPLTAATLCPAGTQLIDYATFKCYRESFQQQLCTKARDATGYMAVPVAFRAAAGAQLERPPFLEPAASSAQGDLVRYRTTLSRSSATCTLTALLHDSSAAMSASQQATVGLCRRVPASA